VPPQSQPFWTVLAEFPLFVLRAFAHPRSLVRGMDWDKPEALQRLALYAVLWLGLLVLAFGSSRNMSELERPRLNTFKGIVMRAHDRSWDPPAEYRFRLRPLYEAFGPDHGAAKRLWDALLRPGFIALSLLLGLLATAIVARLRMWRRPGMAWEYALGTGMLAYLPAATLAAAALVPLALFFICRVCVVRQVLFVVLNLAAWAYMGYFLLGDLGERPYGALATLGKSLAYGLPMFVLTYLIFFALVLGFVPLV
jgi:hypothetical protein